MLYGELKSVGPLNPVQDQLLARVFDEHLRGTMAALRLELDRLQGDTPILRDCHVLMVSRPPSSLPSVHSSPTLFPVS